MIQEASSLVEAVSPRLEIDIETVSRENTLRFNQRIRRNSWFEADWWDFCVPAKDFIECAIALRLLARTNILEHWPLVRKVARRIKNEGDSAVSKSTSAKCRLLEDVFDSAAAVFALSHPDDPLDLDLRSVNQLGFQVGRIHKAHSGPDDWESICRELLRYTIDDEYETVLSVYAEELDFDYTVFHEDPIVQMAIFLFLNARAGLASSIQRKERLSKRATAWIDVIVLSWIANLTRGIFSLESYRLALMMVFTLAPSTTDRGKFQPIVAGELLKRLRNGATH